MRKRTQPQKILHQSDKRFNIGIWGRQSGKTTYGIDKKLVKPLKGPLDANYWYVLQTHDAALVAYNRYKQLFKNAPQLLMKTPHETNKHFQLIGNRNITFKSGENFEDLRIETLDGVIIDEYRQQHPDLWPMVIRPMLAKRKGWADILTTPNGFDHSYDLLEMAKANPAEWGVVQAPSTEAWWWTADEIASAKANMTAKQFSQEILANIENLTVGRVYRNFDEANQCKGCPWRPDQLFDPYLPIILSCDFNRTPMGWLFSQFNNVSYWSFGEIFIESTTDTQEAAIELVARLKEYVNQGWKGDKIIITGDATGEANRTSAIGMTDYSILCGVLNEHKIPYETRVPEKNPFVVDRVNTVNARCLAADGSRSYYMHPEKCPKLKKDLERVVWKEGSRAVLNQTGMHAMMTHISDALGYGLCELFPLRQVGEIGVGLIVR